MPQKSLDSVHILVLLAVVLHGWTCFSSTVTYNFDLTWVSASPDGFTRPVIGINGQWPLPQIDVHIGDSLVINVANHLGNQSTSLHFHGLSMKGFSRMDGASMISQCSIPPGGNFTYNFNVTQVGTYWYHSHTSSQYPDGLRGLLVVREKDGPLKSSYDDEFSITLSDWYHKEMSQMMPAYLKNTNMMAPDPKPDSYLMNDTRDPRFNITAGKTYLVRLVNIGAFKTLKFWIEDHNMTLVEVDGSYIEPSNATVITLTSGQRYAFLLKAKETKSRNYFIGAAIDDSANLHMMKNKQQQDLLQKPVVSGWLVYNSEVDTIEQPSLPADIPTKDMSLIPLDKESLLVNPSVNISLVIDMTRASDGSIRWMFNTIPYDEPEIPTLFSLLTNQTYKNNIQPIILPYNSIVQLTIYNKHMSGHPVHLHGHNFQVVHLSDKSAGPFNTSSAILPPSPVRRDTVMIPGRGNAALRFKADNPGIWFFHCHMEWHARIGLALTFIEAPERIPASESVDFLDGNYGANLKQCAPKDLWESLLAAQHSDRAFVVSSVWHSKLLLLVTLCIIILLGLGTAFTYRQRFPGLTVLSSARWLGFLSLNPLKKGGSPELGNSAEAVELLEGKDDPEDYGEVSDDSSS